ncbi:MAG: hypothetical protein ACOC00_00035 [Halothiobacillaceae bacterium]
MNDGTLPDPVAVPGLSRYDLEPGSWPGFWAKASRPYEFVCRTCRTRYRSVWVGKHSARPICDPCLASHVARAEEPPERPPYPMPPIYQADGSSLMREVRTWAHDREPALALLEGGPGRGKTAQAHHLCAHYHRHGKTYAVMGDRDLVRLDDDRLVAASSASLLVIDEIGRRTTEGCLANLVDVIDRRAPYLRKTLIVTNLGPQQQADLDARLYSRLAQAKRIRFDGPDLRMAAACPTANRKAPLAEDLRYDVPEGVRGKEARRIDSRAWKEPWA